MDTEFLWFVFDEWIPYIPELVEIESPLIAFRYLMGRRSDMGMWHWEADVDRDMTIFLAEEYFDYSPEIYGDTTNDQLFGQMFRWRTDPRPRQVPTYYVEPTPEPPNNLSEEPADLLGIRQIYEAKLAAIKEELKNMPIDVPKSTQNPLEIFLDWAYFTINTPQAQVAIDRGLVTMAALSTYWIILVALQICIILFIPSIFNKLMLNVYEFYVRMVSDQAGKFGAFFVPCLLTIGFVIFMGNTHGLLPFANTITAHFLVTGILALSINLGLFIMGIKRHGFFTFLKTFFPKGITGPLSYLVFVIEFMSYLMRTLSLGVRLFANMLAGHLLLHILSNFLMESNMLIGIVSIYFVLILVLILEIAIALIQTYVFSILVAIYLRDPLVRL